MAPTRLSDACKLQFYRSSVVVTGGHYALTTVLGRLLAQSPGFHLIHEPEHPAPTLSFRTIGVQRFYAFHDGAAYDEVRAALIRLMLGEGFAGDAARRLARVRSPRDIARIARLVQRELPVRLEPRPAIFKAPFLTFTARTMQQVDGMRVVLGVRHPGAWAESVVRRDGGFDFANLLQPALLDALPEYADAIRRFAAERREPIREAVLLWQVIQTFHAKYLLGDARTALFRQEDLIARPRAEAARLFAFAAVATPDGADRFLARSFGGASVDHTGAADYLRRDAQSLLHKWRDRLTGEEQALVRRETEELAAAFGYGEADWAAPPAA